MDAQWANTFWARNGMAASPTAEDLENFATTVGSFYRAQFSSSLSQNWAPQICSALYYGPAGADMGVDVPITGNGGSANEDLPASAAACVSWHVQQRYKGGHPRTYLCGLTTVAITGPTTIEPAWLSSLADAANNFHAAVNGFAAGNLNDVHLGVVSFVLRNEWRTPPVFRDYVPDTATVDSRIDSQRRRLGRDRA